MLPFSSADGRAAPFLDCLFTATSATCVTGLIVRDTATAWSAFGQTVILVLIQIGGLGVVTMAVLLSRIGGKRLGLLERKTMQDSVAAPTVGGAVPYAKFILMLTFLFEGAGALLLLFPMIRQFGVGRGIFAAFFHAISAFCNAGFDLFGSKEAFSSLTTVSGNVWIVGVIMVMIVCGGLGFLTWQDLRENGFRFRRYRMQSKMILFFTLFLLLIPAILFFLFDFSDLPLGERTLASLFQSVTARTAGFNTVPLDTMSEPGMIVFILLMLTGGAPGSTAGGMKVTTMFLVLMAALSVFRRRDGVTCFGRRLREDTVRQAMGIMLLYLVLFLVGGCVISMIEGLPLLPCLFETASAVGTVGVTLGLTPTLGAVSHVILIALMFLGRVGGLTLIYATLSGARVSTSKLPVDTVAVG